LAYYRNGNYYLALSQGYSAYCIADNKNPEPGDCTIYFYGTGSVEPLDNYLTDAASGNAYVAETPIFEGKCVYTRSPAGYYIWWEPNAQKWYISSKLGDLSYSFFRSLTTDIAGEYEKIGSGNGVISAVYGILPNENVLLFSEVQGHYNTEIKSGEFGEVKEFGAGILAYNSGINIVYSVIEEK